MSNGIFLSVALGFLLGYDYLGKMRLFSKNSQLSDFLKSNLNLIVQSILLILAYVYVYQRVIAPQFGGEFKIIFVALLAYALSVVDKNNQYLPIATSLVCFFSIEHQEVPAVISAIYTGMFVSLSAILFNFLMQGVNAKLVFSNTPPVLSGMPMRLLVGSILALILGAIQNSF